MARQGLSIAFAESATAGWLCSEFALTEESGQVLKGGIACYDAGLKVKLLGVPQQLIEQYTPESMEVTREMAYRLKEVIPSDIQVTVTGLTTPGGSETPEKPVGTMFIFALIRGREASLRQVFSGSCEEVIQQTVAAAAALLLSHLSVQQILLKDDGRFPNSPLPVLIYKGVLDLPLLFPATHLSKLFEKNGWSNSWDAGIFQYHHYHSVTHEALGIYSGSTTLQLGGGQGPKITIEKGDVVIIPAGVAHKNLGKENDVGAVGAYPDGRDYDMNYGKNGERPGTDEHIAQVPLPLHDPLGLTDGLTKIWKGCVPPNGPAK